MKKTVLAFIIILVGMFLFLSLIDTSDYVAGKKLWRGNKRFVEIARDPNVVPKQEFENLADSYTTILADYPDSQFVPLIKFQIGKLLTLKGSYGEARKSFAEIAEQYAGNSDMCTRALLYVGMTYEKEARGKEAIKIYKKIMSAYPRTDIGLRMPMLIMRYYKRAGDKGEALKAYLDAVAFYTKIHEENHDNVYGFRALNILSQAYLNQKNWEKAVDVLARMLIEYSSLKFVDYRKVYNIIKTINTVSLTHLKNYDRPKAIYTEFLEENPQHPIKRVLSEMIVAIDELKGNQDLPEGVADNVR